MPSDLAHRFSPPRPRCLIRGDDDKNTAGGLGDLKVIVLVTKTQAGRFGLLEEAAEIKATAAAVLVFVFLS